MERRRKRELVHNTKDTEEQGHQQDIDTTRRMSVHHKNTQIKRPRASRPFQGGPQPSTRSRRPPSTATNASASIADHGAAQPEPTSNDLSTRGRERNGIFSSTVSNPRSPWEDTRSSNFYEDLIENQYHSNALQNNSSGQASNNGGSNMFSWTLETPIQIQHSRAIEISELGAGASHQGFPLLSNSWAGTTAALLDTQTWMAPTTPRGLDPWRAGHNALSDALSSIENSNSFFSASVPSAGPALRLRHGDTLAVLLRPPGQAVTAEVRLDFQHSFINRATIKILGLVAQPIPKQKQKPCFTPLGSLTPEWFVTVAADVAIYGINNIILDVQVLEDNDPRAPMILGGGFANKASRHQRMVGPGSGTALQNDLQQSQYNDNQMSLIPPPSQSSYTGATDLQGMNAYPPSYGQSSPLSQSPSGLFTAVQTLSTVDSEVDDIFAFETSSYTQGGSSLTATYPETESAQQDHTYDTVSTPRLSHSTDTVDNDQCG